MQSSTANGGRVPLQPPPADRLPDRVRRRLRALGAYSGIRHWLLVRGSVVLGALLVLYVTNGMINGWKIAYDVAIGITSPGDEVVAMPAPAWLLSVAGWLGAPAVFGAVAGAVVSIAIGERRRQSISEALGRPGGPRD